MKHAVTARRDGTSRRLAGLEAQRDRLHVHVVGQDQPAEPELASQAARDHLRGERRRRLLVEARHQQMADITASMPASMAARNGTHSTCSSRSGRHRRPAGPRVNRPTPRRAPGNAWRTPAALPAGEPASAPRRGARPRPDRWTAPDRRWPGCPCASTHREPAQSQRDAHRAQSRPSAQAKRRVRSRSSARPSAAAAGQIVSGALTRCTRPPSWSMATHTGADAKVPPPRVRVRPPAPVRPRYGQTARRRRGRSRGRANGFHGMECPRNPATSVAPRSSSVALHHRWGL